MIRHTPARADPGSVERRLRWSGRWWACQDLNLGPHPYQGSARRPVPPGRDLLPGRPTHRLRPLETTGNRSAPMACGPNVDQGWRGGRVARSCPVADASGASILRLGTEFGPDRLAGHGKADHGLDRRSPACKPDRAGSLPAERVNGAGRGRPGAVRGCLPGTSHVCCEWARCGTVDENNDAPPGSDASSSAVE